MPRVVLAMGPVGICTPTARGPQILVHEQRTALLRSVDISSVSFQPFSLLSPRRYMIAAGERQGAPPPVLARWAAYRQKIIRGLDTSLACASAPPPRT